MLQIKNLTKIYENGKVGAQDVNLHVESGDIYAFIGHNGAGKTTTIKCVVGIHDFTSGEILIDGISMKENPIECKKRIAYIPDNPEVYGSLTGLQYLNFVANVFQVGLEERKQKIEEFAKKLEIFHDLGMQIANYSRGMKQKLIIVSALLHAPKLLILDEPFVGLDPKASFILKQMMQDFVKQGNSIFFSTHVLEVAEKLCNKVAIIKNAKIIHVGTMQEVKKNASLEDVFLESANESV